MKTQHFSANMLCQKPMLREIEWEVQNGLNAKNGVLLVTALYFWTFINSWFDKRTTKMFIFECYLTVLYPCEYP